MRRDPLRDACTFREAFHGSVGGVTVHSLSVGSEENRPGRALVDVEIERPACSWGEGDGDVFAALAHDCQCAVAAVHAHRFDVGAERFADSESVECEE